tara:strand:+ start:638 stop:2176 length:1539 start_codon:yes stop_codon:yes gene_type:complete
MPKFRFTGDYYISPSGNDANNGTTPDTPFATIQAAVDAAGATTSLTFVIGSGTYNEVLTRASSANSNLTWTLQGDGEVILNGNGVSQSNNVCISQYAEYWRNCTFNDLTFANWLRGFNETNQNYFYPNTFNRCTFINITSMYAASTSATLSYNFCTFIKSNFSAQRHIQNHYMRNCVFLKSSYGFDINNLPTGYYNNGTNSAINNIRFQVMEDCLFANPFDDEPTLCLMVTKYNSGSSNTNPAANFKNVVFDNNVVIQSLRYSSNDSSFLNYTQSATEFVDEINQYGTWLDGSGSNAGPANNTSNVSPNTILNYPLSYNGNELTGSTDLYNTLGAPYSLDFNNESYFNASQQPITRTIASQIPAIAYGTSNTATNAFHTAGGATWENIIETGSGFILSSSALISGSIESAVIDQGASKVINNIQFNWSTNDANQGVISYYTSSQIIQNYQLRYGDAADLSAEEYKLFPINDIPYLDANGSGSGDNNFLTGSTDPITARYLQFKLTLRNNWNG